jgi:hypothetical protein
MCEVFHITSYAFEAFPRISADMDCAGTERGEVLKDGQSLSIENVRYICINWGIVV